MEPSGSLPITGCRGVFPYRDYDVTRDGQQFLVALPPGQADSDASEAPQIILVQNWFEELKRLVPGP